VAWESNLLSGNQQLELLMSIPFKSSLVTLLSPFQNAFHWKYRFSQPGRRRAPLLGALLFSLLAICGAPRPTTAHAVLVESTPAPKSTSPGPDVAIRLRFNVRIDAGRSIITLIREDGSSVKLQTVKQPAANVLAATGAGLLAGEYRIRWQVLASDGHITSGEIPFSVAAS
jgi:copper resistance protein C